MKEMNDRATREITEIRVNIEKFSLDNVEITVKEREVKPE